MMWTGSHKSCKNIQTKLQNIQRRGRNCKDKGYHGDTLGRIGFVTTKQCKQNLNMEKLKKLIKKDNIELVDIAEVCKDWRN